MCPFFSSQTAWAGIVVVLLWKSRCFVANEAGGYDNTTTLIIDWQAS